MKTITRKFLVKKLPDLTKIKLTHYDRYYLYAKNEIVIRIQNVGDSFELERKIDKTDLTREEQKIEITKDEFYALKKIAYKNIARDSYLISENPKIKLRVYHGDYEGLVRAEVEFSSVEEAQGFKPPEWFGQEITNNPLGKEGELLNLSKKEFKKFLK